MATLAQVKKQIQQLEKQAEALLKVERAKAISSIKRAMAEFNVTIDELTAGTRGFGKPQKTDATKVLRKVRVATPPKYLDPKTGKTWSGRGKPPNWIAKGKRESFLIVAEPATNKQPHSATKSTRTPKAKAPAKAKTPIKKAVPEPRNTTKTATKDKVAVSTKPAMKKAAKAKLPALKKVTQKTVKRPATKSKQPAVKIETIQASEQSPL